MIHIAGVTQIRLDTDGRTYYRRKRAEGKKSLEALRCLKRRISDTVYRQLTADAERAAGTAGTESGAVPLHCRRNRGAHIGSGKRPAPVRGGKTDIERTLFA